MEETAEQYARRVLAYVMKSTKAVDLHDPELEPVAKAEEPKNVETPVEKMVREFEHPETVKKAAMDPKNPFEKMVSEFEES